MHPTATDVLGIVSLILWALMAMVSLKYVTFVLRADNEGEGGILALLSLVAAGRVANGARLPVLVLIGVIGASLLYGDGVITPAISVLSAMEGLKLIAPVVRAFHRAGDDSDPDRPVRDPALRHRTDRQVLRPGHGGMVRRAGAARRGQHPDCAGDPAGGQSAAGRTLSDRRSQNFIRGDRRGVPGADRRRGALCRHGPCRRDRDPPRLVRPGAAGAAVELFRPGRADPERSLRHPTIRSTGWRPPGR